MQELALSRDAVVMQGTKSMSWERFSQVTQLLPHLLSMSKATMANKLGDYDSNLRRFQSRITCREFGLMQDKYKTVSVHELSRRLIDLCHTMLQKDATDPRDMVYGIYSLLPKTNIKLPLVDYVQDTEVVFLYFAASITKMTSALWLLLFVDIAKLALLNCLRGSLTGVHHRGRGTAP